MPFCPQCGVDNPASARFCDQCGAVLIPVSQPEAAAPPPVSPAATGPTMLSSAPVAGPNSCPQCGAGVIPGEAFCDNCGAALLNTSSPAASGGQVPPAPGLPYGGVPAQPSYPPPVPVGVAAPPVQPPPVQPPPVQPQAATPPVAPVAPAQPATPGRSTLAPGQLVFAAGGTSLNLPSVPQAVVGRADPVSGFFPDIDLTPHGALDNGVGRRHMRLFVQNGQLQIEDLDSTNGTFLNTTRLAPRSPQPLRNGDELRLGKLLMKVVL